jgi:hypothetical protein
MAQPVAEPLAALASGAGGVPECFGWLRLDARGRWWVRDPAGRFGLISNPSLIEFIGRHYRVDEQGRGCFQNGPQRVYVECEYTPYVYRLDDRLRGLVTHNGLAASRLCALLVDEHGALVLQAEPGPGVVLDRDLAGFLARLRTAEGQALDPAVLLERSAAPRVLQGFGFAFEVRPVLRENVPGLLGYARQPESLTSAVGQRR